MLRLKILVLILVSILLTSLPAEVQAGQDKKQLSGKSEPVIQVGLWVNQQNIVISADTDYELRNELNEIVGSFTPKEKIALSIKNSSIIVNGTEIRSSELSVVARDGKREILTEVNKRHYRGDISILRTKNKAGLTVVNTLPIEQYLYGIIAKEISPDWAIEAVKAQAVAARTYALYSLNKHREDGFDVCATSDCQVYGGKDSEAARSIQAVEETRGLTMLYQGKPINALFHSSSGGYTENSENVWGGYLPYIRGVSDFDQSSPHFKWSKEMTPAEFEQILIKAGYRFGRLQAIELSRLAKAPLAASDRGISGRIKTLTVIGSEGSVQLSGQKFRTIFGLNSTLFDIDTIVPMPKAIEVDITDSGGDHYKKKVEVNLPPAKEQGLLSDKREIRRITGRAQEMLVFSGFGWGHGLGLSQWGAKAMAEKAPPGEPAYFQTILKHYYQGIEIKKAY